MTYQQIVDKWGGVSKLAAEKYGLRHSLVLAIVRQESSGLENAISPAHCYGLMQISPYALIDYNGNNGTQTILSELFLPEVNIEVGCWYYKWLFKQFKNDFDALRAYNIGIGNVRRGKLLHGSDGTKYAKSVLDHENQFQIILAGSEKTA